MIQCWKRWLSSHGALLFLEEAFLGEERWGGLGGAVVRKCAWKKNLFSLNKKQKTTSHSTLESSCAEAWRKYSGQRHGETEKMRLRPLCVIYFECHKSFSLSPTPVASHSEKDCFSYTKVVCAKRTFVCNNTLLVCFSAHFLATPELPYTWFGFPWLKYHYHLVKYLICVQVILSGRCSTLPHLSRE